MLHANSVEHGQPSKVRDSLAVNRATRKLMKVKMAALSPPWYERSQLCLERPVNGASINRASCSYRRACRDQHHRRRRRHTSMYRARYHLGCVVEVVNEVDEGGPRSATSDPSTAPLSMAETVRRTTAPSLLREDTHPARSCRTQRSLHGASRSSAGRDISATMLDARKKNIYKY